MKTKLPAAVSALIKKRGAVLDPKLRASKAQLIKTCKEYGYAPHASVIAFEAAFGGLLMPDGPKMKKDEPVWLFGTYACLTSGAHTEPRGGSKSRKLVPVVYSPNDVIYFLDEQGHGYAQDTIEDVTAVRCADDAISLVSHIVTRDVMFPQADTSVALPTQQAGAIKEMYLGSKKLETLPESLWSEAQLTLLDLSFNPLKTIPDEIGKLQSLNSLSLRGCPIATLPGAITALKNLTRLILTECVELDVDKALQVIARIPKLNELWLPLSSSLTSLAPLAQLPLKSLVLNGTYVKYPRRLPPGLGKLKKLTDLDIRYADDVSELPEAPEDIRMLRLLFSKKFTDDDIRQSALKQPEKLYLQAFAKTL